MHLGPPHHGTEYYRISVRAQTSPFPILFLTSSPGASSVTVSGELLFFHGKDRFVVHPLLSFSLSQTFRNHEGPQAPTAGSKDPRAQPHSLLPLGFHPRTLPHAVAPGNRSLCLPLTPVLQMTFCRWFPRTGSTSGGTSTTSLTPQRPGTVPSSSVCPGAHT